MQKELLWRCSDNEFEKCAAFNVGNIAVSSELHGSINLLNHYRVLTQNRNARTAECYRNKDGVLHIIGSLADTLLKRKMYKDQIELLLTTHVLPEFRSEYGFMRARVSIFHFYCWIIKQKHLFESAVQYTHSVFNYSSKKKRCPWLPRKYG